jgi:hypothetical protein
MRGWAFRSSIRLFNSVYLSAVLKVVLFLILYMYVYYHPGCSILKGESKEGISWTAQCGDLVRSSYQPCEGYTHKMSGFKTSGFKTSGFKTSETSGLQNVRFTKCQVYKCGWWKSAGSVAAMFAGKVPYITIIASNK